MLLATPLRAETESSSPFEKGWELGDPRIEIFDIPDVSDAESGELPPDSGTGPGDEAGPLPGIGAQPFPGMGITPLAMPIGQLPSSIEVSVQMPANPDWDYATETDGCYPNARLTIRSGYSGNDYVYGYDPNNAAFANNSAIHCIDPGMNAPAAGGAGILTLNLKRNVTWNGQIWAEYYGAGLMPPYQNYYGDYSTQRMGVFLRIPILQEGYIIVTKSSNNPDVSNGNANYSMAGIKYDVYNSANLSNKVSSIAINSGGSGQCGPLPYGTYWVQEAPKTSWDEPARSSGYLRSTEKMAVTIDSATSVNFLGNQVAYLNTQDDLLAAQVGALIKKTDAQTGQAVGADGGSVAGAEFTVRYWKGYYNTVDAALAAGAPTRTWVLKTDSNGKTNLDNEHKVSGNSFYLNNGKPSIPLGTIVIQETKAPAGYLLPSPNTAYLQQVKLNANLTGVTVPNEISIPEVPRGLTVKKVDAQTGEALAGAKFTLYRESKKGAGDWKQVYQSKTANQSGTVEWSPIEPGSYKVVEVRPPEHYMLPSESGLSDEQFFEVTQTGTEPISFVSFSDYKKPNIEVLKTDMEAKPLADTEFTVYSFPVALTDGKIVTNLASIPEDDPAWKEVGKLTTDDDGKLVFPDLVFGYYKICETRPNIEYASSKEFGGQPHLVALDKNCTGEVQVFENEKIDIKVAIYKKTIALTSSALDGTVEDAANNVGVEEYQYTFGARNCSNVYLDEFCVEDDLEPLADLGYRIVSLWTGTSPLDLDFDNSLTLLYRTNKSTGQDVPDFQTNPLNANPENPNNPDRRMYLSNTSGWSVWKEGISTTESEFLDISTLELDEDEYITGIKVVYGGVKADFFTGVGYMNTLDAGLDQSFEPNSVRSGDQRPLPGDGAVLDWMYSVVATQGLRPLAADGAETVITNSIAAVGVRNDGVLRSDDQDEVRTRVIEPFTFATRANTIVSFGGDSSSETPSGVDSGQTTPRTGEQIILYATIAASLVIGATLLILAYRRSKRQAAKRRKH
ncbi:MAG: hypothetical protein LBH87_01175 [Coriobacteriales bacterium]|nr:hypothetical protein [Coriobacteriales bacterium]